MIDFFAEIGSSFKWVYRGWLFLLSSAYREAVRSEYSGMQTKWKALDVAMSILFFCVELFFVVLLIGNF